MNISWLNAAIDQWSVNGTSDASNRTSSTRASNGSGDAVSVTLNSTLQALQAQAAGMPEIRSDRVDALRTALQNGSYRLDPVAIANAVYGTLYGEN